MTDEFTLRLDKYERDNLLALLHLIFREPGGPFCLDTGDWVGQIYWKLASGGLDDNEHAPNQRPSEMLKALNDWRRP